MGAPVGKRFRRRGSVGALRSVYSFFNVSPGVPGKQSIQFLIKEPIIKVPAVPATQARLLRGPHLGTLGFPKAAREGVRFGAIPPATPGKTEIFRSQIRPAEATPAALAAVTVSSGERPAPGIRGTPTMRASATRHRRRLRILAGEPGFPSSP